MANHGWRLCALLILVSMLMACSTRRERIDQYGVDRFIIQVLAYEQTGAIPLEMKELFEPLRAKVCLNGVLLLFSQTDTWEAGIYVDRGDVENQKDNVFDMDVWHHQIAWVRIKVRDASP